MTSAREVKPAGRALADAVAEVRARAHHRPRPRTTALVLDLPDEAPKRSTCAPGGAFFEAFMRLAADGARPTVVLASRAADRDHLTARGITETVTVDDVDRP